MPTTETQELFRQVVQRDGEVETVIVTFLHQAGGDVLTTHIQKSDHFPAKSWHYMLCGTRAVPGNKYIAISSETQCITAQGVTCILH